MSNLKISQLTTSTAQTGDLVPIARSGANYAVPVQSIGGGGVVLSATGDGGILGPGIMVSQAGQFNGALASANTLAIPANDVVVWQFVLNFTLTITKVSIYVNDGSLAPGALVSFGIYSKAGSKLVDSGVFTIPAGTIAQTYTNTITSVTLTPGVYYFAETTTNSSVNVLGMGVATGTTSVGSFYSMLDLQFPRVGVGANASALGVLPSTLGTVTNINSAAGMPQDIGMAWPLFEP